MQLNKWITLGAISAFLPLVALADHGGNDNNNNANNDANGSFESSVVGSTPGATIGGVMSGGAPLKTQGLAGESACPTLGFV